MTRPRLILWPCIALTTVISCSGESVALHDAAAADVAPRDAAAADVALDALTDALELTDARADAPEVLAEAGAFDVVLPPADNASCEAAQAITPRRSPPLVVSNVEPAAGAPVTLCAGASPTIDGPAVWYSFDVRPLSRLEITRAGGGNAAMVVLDACGESACRARGAERVRIENLTVEQLMPVRLAVGRSDPAGAPPSRLNLTLRQTDLSTFGRCSDPMPLGLDSPVSGLALAGGSPQVAGCVAGAALYFVAQAPPRSVLQARLTPPDRPWPRVRILDSCANPVCVGAPTGTPSGEDLRNDSDAARRVLVAVETDLDQSVQDYTLTLSARGL